MNKYIALDIETGGIGHDKSLLTVYFAVVDTDMNVIAELDLLTKPKDGIYTVTGEALGINKINLVEHDQKAICYDEAARQIYRFLQEINPNGKVKLIPIGHNVKFDIQFICQKLISKGTWYKFVSYRVLDTGAIAQFLIWRGVLKENEVSGSLSSLATYFNIKTNAAHTAKGDVEMCLDILREIKKWD